MGQLVQSLGLKQPHNGIAHSDAEALEIAADIGFPLVIRPSYVLGGRAMEIVRDQASLERYIRDAVVVSGKSPVLLDHYLSGAVELDVDALSDEGEHDEEHRKRVRRSKSRREQEMKRRKKNRQKNKNGEETK